MTGRRCIDKKPHKPYLNHHPGPERPSYSPLPFQRKAWQIESTCRSHQPRPPSGTRFPIFVVESTTNTKPSPRFLRARCRLPTFSSIPFFFFCRPAIAHALVFNTHCRFRGQGDNSNVGELGFWPKNLILSSVETRSKSCAKQGGNHHAYARIGFYLKITALPNMATIQPDRKGVCPMTTLIVSFRLLINPSPSLSNHPHGRIIHFQVFIPSPFIINSLASGPLLSATLLCHVEEIAVS